MIYEGKLYRPPSEHDAWILQATIGCSWNHCTYCDMYRDKRYRERPVPELLTEIDTASAVLGPTRKVFVADGDALGMPTESWVPVLKALRAGFGGLKRVSCYAMARNVLAKSADELATLRRLGLTRLYIGPETGDDVTGKRIAKGATFAEHAAAAEAAHAAGMEISVIALLGAGGVERTVEHAEATGRLVTAMDPEFFAALTLTVVPGTPQATLQDRGKYVLPDKPSLFRELRTMVAVAEPTDALFRTNHASNYLPLSGRLPQDRHRICAIIDAALAGAVPLRPEWSRGL
ncbi:MAG: radical SAM superfamily enzyme YgiQ (UPF0313 family) [Myxococcota bacterium]|jgi:radical SAM superfamily enzyme YgiQ (UPF0313 family)